MNEQMVIEWNAMIAPEDTVYILGDVAFLPAAKAAEYMMRCNGNKILIEGNHDRKTLQDPEFRACFCEVHKYLDVQFNEIKVVMFHYPIAEWDQMHCGSVHLHGHLHGGTSGMERYRAVDVGMDSTGAIAISMDEAIRLGLKGAIKEHH